MQIFDTGRSLIVLASVADEWERWLMPADREHLSRFGSPVRRAEVAAWRGVVRQVVGDVEISYDEVGAPLISYPESSVRGDTGAVLRDNCAGGDMQTIRPAKILKTSKWTHIGVSHSGDYVAVIFSTGRCAIDMENTSRNFDRAAARFISACEQSLSESGEPLFKAAVWCGKETLYKLSGRRELNLLEDLRITAVEFFESEQAELFGSVPVEVPENATTDISNCRALQCYDLLSVSDRHGLSYYGRMAGAIRSRHGQWDNCEMAVMKHGDCLVVFAEN